VDKPSLGVWLQAFSARSFGHSAVSLMLFGAIAGVLAVYLPHHSVRQTFQAPAALLAAGFLAIPPIDVVTNRVNILESVLALTMLGAIWMVLLAIQRQALKYLVFAAIFVGFGINAKMMAAFLIIPALVLVYVKSAAWPARRIWTHLALAGATTTADTATIAQETV
jgi:4-amino-4-deoxy-L-arabinose transferase-like glycosyltransferase